MRHDSSCRSKAGYPKTPWLTPAKMLKNNTTHPETATPVAAAFPFPELFDILFPRKTRGAKLKKTPMMLNAEIVAASCRSC